MTVWIGILMFLLIFVTAAMIGLILIQRGKGGGLAGVFGGGGVEQAFGTRATTLAQKATGVLAVLFVVISVILGLAMQKNREGGPTRPATAPASTPATPSDAAPAAPAEAPAEGAAK